MPAKLERSDRNRVRIERTSYGREIAALGVLVLAGGAAFLIVAGPSLLVAPPEGDRLVVAPERRAADAALNARPLSSVSIAGGDDRAYPPAPGVPPRSAGVPPPQSAAVSGPHSAPARAADSLGKALDRAIARGWLTVDPPGRPPDGMALFPAPGTVPLLEGVIVPDGFELPPGYVRHYQVTDDGEQLPPILMFSPDYEWIDDTGAVVAVPSDGVVPPDRVPPGMPIELLTPPERGAAPADPWGRPRRDRR